MTEHTPAELSAKEVCQVLREVTLGRRSMNKAGTQGLDEVYACHFVVDVKGWRITLYNDCDGTGLLRGMRKSRR